MKKKLIKFREKYIGPNLSISYDNPLHLIKSTGQYVYDNKGKKYLDAVNNINHIEKLILLFISFTSYCIYKLFL